MTRLAAQALVYELNAELLSTRSATASLESWCGRHQLADPPRVRVLRVGPEQIEPTPAQRARLRVSSDERVRYRHVQLRCGERVLSDAENWYVPGRLSVDMNRELDHSDVPFGKVVKPLEPSRRTFSSTRLWSPLPEGWETRAPEPDHGNAGGLVIPAALLEHRALLYDGVGRPLAELHEIYRRDLLDFPLMSGAR